MGGANSIVNVFDVNSYNQTSLNAMKMAQQRERRSSNDAADDSQSELVGQTAQRNVKFGADMLVQKKPGADGDADAEDGGRFKNFNEYEIQKYMQKDIKPIHLPDMPTYMRA